METINFKNYTSIDIYNYCLDCVGKKPDGVTGSNYRLGLLELKQRGELDLIYSIALNASY